MSKYTTGEVAKICDITVRTVQYYDNRGILVPSELTEGGRRLYSEDDVKRMKIICFLRDLGLSIDTIGQLLEEEDPGSVIELLLKRQENDLKNEIRDSEEKLKKVLELRDGLRSLKDFSVESIADIAYIMTNKEELRKTRITMILTAIPLAILQWTAIILWVTKGFWPLFLIWAIIALPYAIVVSRWYFKKVDYICPKCHKVVKPTFKQMFWANHTPNTRKLTCPHCGHRGFCVEVAATSNPAEQE